MGRTCSGFCRNTLRSIVQELGCTFFRKINYVKFFIKFLLQCVWMEKKVKEFN